MDYDILKTQQEYLNHALTFFSGLKALVVDSVTTSIVSHLFSMMDVAQKEIYIITNIADKTREPLYYATAMCVLHPSKFIIDRLVEELKVPKYKQYYIFFTSPINDGIVETLAEADVHEIVQTVQELYMDVCAVTPSVYSLNTSPTLSDQLLVDRAVDALISTLISYKEFPIIRYQQHTSNLPYNISLKIHQKIQESLKTQDGLFPMENTSTTLLILHRSFDCATPLLIQWTYQAMINEFLGINNNLIDLPSGKVEFSYHNDPFYQEVHQMMFADVSETIQARVNAFVQSKDDKLNFSTMEDMQRAIDSIPELTKERENLTKHSNVLSTAVKVYNSKKALQLSAFEQELVVNNTLSTSLAELNKIVNDMQIPYEDRLKEAVLFSYRFPAKAEDVRSMLQLQKFKPEDMALVKTVITYGEKNPLPVFSEEKGLKSFVKKIVKGSAGIESVYTQHKPLIEKIAMGMLYNDEKMKKIFPSFGDIHKITQNLIIFIVGGVCLEESVCMSQIKKTYKDQGMVPPRILIGGTEVLNSQKFIAMLRQKK
ncbi:vacuolar protein sorting-associated protein, putative [Entamoeba invadens IP1]|uniref:Vacuolar protein sorting-associated protein, putative n=1 Tax=Entamoeba invadens IP1 TaxID=370355 RepID=A0A0A1TU37_ENTIV|nr:vacuolar protein sorting-associated protein, putative [Entamoeba invadens IP1]ELP83442.1 vacuolar protein sorting-associated protein, putative [Entamoeba invadens IP1]|eukprot:XP_004182788.1 vacuolar protein sorting-associated protein, putative [Entamoeba invadens IP1]